MVKQRDSGNSLALAEAMETGDVLILGAAMVAVMPTV